MTLKKRAVQFVVSCLFAGLLGACGGGGGGNDSAPVTPIGTAPPTGTNPPATGTPGTSTPGTETPGTPPPVSTAKVLTFSAPAASATVEAGRSASISADAVVTTPADFATAGAVYAYIVDTDGVILPQVQLTQTGTYAWRAVMQTVPTLAAGKYSGNFAVKVCRDTACAQQFPGSPMQLPYEITVTAAALPVVTAAPVSNLDLTINTGKAAPDPLSVRVNAAGRTWTAATDAKWLTLLDASGNGDGAFRVKYEVAALALGTQTANIVVTASDGQSVTLPVKAQLLPVAFSVDRNQITFTAVNGAPVAAEAVKFNIVDGAVTWAASTNVPWLGITPTGGPTPGITTLKVDPAAGSLASGQYAGLVTITAPGVQTSTVPVTLNLSKATFKASAPSVTLGGAYGREHDQATVSLNLNTLGNAHPWSLSALPAWLGASAAAGQVSQTGAGVTFSPNPGALPTGTSVATLTVTARVNGDVLATPVTVTAHRDVHKLLFSETGVAFSSTPNWSRLSRTVSVSDNFGQASSWSASADQAWLTVARSGNKLTLTANPATLPNNAISYATVRLSSDDATISTAETLRVALWKGSSTPNAIKKLNKSYTHLKTDPIRPYLYANTGGTGIDVYNVYTAALVGTVGNLGGALGAMSVSQDGATLYAYDTANRNIVLVDLATLTKARTWPLASAVSQSSTLLAIRPNGVQLVVASDGATYDALTGAAVGNAIISPKSATSDGKRLYSVGGAADIDFSAMGGGTLFSKYVGSIGGSDVAVSGDGTRVYTATGAPYRCMRYSTTDFSEIGSLPGGDAYPNNVEVGSDGRVYCGISGWYSSADVWLHSAEGAILNSFKFAGYARALTDGSMQISGDGLVMLGQTDDPFLVFVPVGP